MVARNRARYFAKRLFEAIDPWGTDEHLLNRVVVGRCDQDMVQVKLAYKQDYKKSLKDAIKVSFCFHSKKFMV